MKTATEWAKDSDDYDLHEFTLFIRAVQADALEEAEKACRVIAEMWEQGIGTCGEGDACRQCADAIFEFKPRGNVPHTEK